MKPCPQFRRELAVQASDGEASGLLAQHLAQCPACHEYFESIRQICRDQEQAAQNLGEEFAGHVVARVAAQLAGDNRPRRYLRFPRVAWGLGLATLVTLTTTWLLDRPEPQPAPLEIAREPQTRPANQMAYRLALNRSFEDLDRLLAKESVSRNTAQPSLFQARALLAE